MAFSKFPRRYINFLLTYLINIDVCTEGGNKSIGGGLRAIPPVYFSGLNDKIVVDTKYYYQYIIGAMQLIAFILVALYSCVYAFRRLTRPGMSKEIRYVFIRKHIIYVSTFILLWTVSLAHLYFAIYVAAQKT